MAKISIFILAFNEAEKIAEAVKSVLWADEIILVDSYSTDNTADIAAKLGANVVQVPFSGFGNLRNQALTHCQHEWIFSLDADERCTPQVAEEIKKIINDSQSADVYHVPRKNIFFGRWIKHVWPYPNYRQPQLFKKGCLQYRDETVHEGFDVQTNKSIGYLHNAIWQIPFINITQIFYKADRYSTLRAQSLAKAGKKGSVWQAITHGCWSFIKHYFIKRGFLDGWQGFLIAVSSAEGTFYRYIKLKVLNKESMQS